METSLDTVENGEQRSNKPIREEIPSSSRTSVILTATSANGRNSKFLTRQNKRLHAENRKLKLKIAHLTLIKQKAALLEVQVSDQNTYLRNQFAVTAGQKSNQESVRDDQATISLLQKWMHDEIEIRAETEKELQKVNKEKQFLLRSKKQYDKFYKYVKAQCDDQDEKELMAFANQFKTKNQSLRYLVKRFKPKKIPPTQPNQVEEVKSVPSKKRTLHAGQDKKHAMKIPKPSCSSDQHEIYDVPDSD